LPRPPDLADMVISASVGDSRIQQHGYTAPGQNVYEQAAMDRGLSQSRVHRNEAEVMLTDNPRPEDLQFIEDQLNEHNMVRTGRRDFRPLGLWVRDDRQRIVAGLYGFTWADWLEVRLVWVREDLRGQGHGRRLVESAEAEARARGCRRVWLDSYTFQAPGFYQRLGYQVFGVLHDYPAPHGRVFLTKTL
jgi:GNAT superfamily N-acetyltransferase